MSLVFYYRRHPNAIIVESIVPVYKKEDVGVLSVAHPWYRSSSVSNMKRRATSIPTSICNLHRISINRSQYCLSGLCGTWIQHTFWTIYAVMSLTDCFETARFLHVKYETSNNVFSYI